MKKTIAILMIITAFQFSSCKKEMKKENEKIESKKMAFSLDKATNTINFTAYKTTAKVGVNGQFKKVTITKNGNANSIKEAINNAEFSIPVSSIFTKDSSRDYKIQEFFFKIMENTALLSGKLNIEDATQGYAEIKMNGITNKLPFKYTITDNTFTLNAVMNLSEWKATAALNSLNEACKALHTGEDGVSKTWDEVAIKITSAF